MKKSVSSKTQKQEQVRKLNRIFNLVCAGVCVVLMLLYFCDFFRYNRDNIVLENQTSGFAMAVWLFRTPDVNDVLQYIDAGKVQFASVASMLGLAAVAAMIITFIVQAIAKKPVLSVTVLISGGVTLLFLIVQTVALSGLASEVTIVQGCATCIGQSLAFLTLIFFVMLSGAVYGMSEFMSKNHGTKLIG